MVTIERMNEIYDLLQKNGVVRVDELAGRFQVSEMTIRRDLEKMEREGRLIRCHGGAVQKMDLARDKGFDSRAALNRETKERLAQYCLDHYVHEGMVLYLDAGSTVLALANLLPAVPGLTVVTNDVRIADTLAESGRDVIILGGHVQAELGCIYGHTAEEQLENYRVDAAFVSGLCVDDNFDVFAEAESKAYFRRRLHRCARQVFMVIDASKFHRRSLFKINSLADYTAVVTDWTPTEAAAQSEVEWVTV